MDIFDRLCLICDVSIDKCEINRLLFSIHWNFIDFDFVATFSNKCIFRISNRSQKKQSGENKIARERKFISYL